MLHPINYLSVSANFLVKIGRIFNIFAKIFRDLQNVWHDLWKFNKIVKDVGRKIKDPWRSWQKNEILARIWKLLKYFSKIFRDLQNVWHHLWKFNKIVKDVGRKIKDPWRSWQKNEILARIWKLLKYFSKIF